MGGRITRRTKAKTVTIANGESLSGEINIEGYAIVAIIMPAAWTAANLTFQGAPASGGTFTDVHDDGGTELAVTAAASRAIGNKDKLETLMAFQFIKIRSGTSGVPVNQAAARTLTLVLKA